jgi:PAS domain S-box-containing protein
LISRQHIADKAVFDTVLLDAWFAMEDECVSVWEEDTLSLVYINVSGCRIFGYESSDDLMQNHSFYCFSRGGAVEMLTDEIKLSLDQTGQWKDNANFYRRDGSQFHGRVNLVRFSHHGKNYILKRVLDIQDQKNVSENLLREKKKFEALFQFATMAILVADKEGNIILSNKLALSLFGYEGAEFSKMYPTVKNLMHTLKAGQWGLGWTSLQRKKAVMNFRWKSVWAITRRRKDDLL